MSTRFSDSPSTSSPSNESGASVASAPVPFRVVAFGAAVLDPNGPPPAGSKLRIRSGVRGGIVIGSRHGDTPTRPGIVIGS